MKKKNILIFSIVLLLAISFWMGWEIYSRSTQQLLWGYRPLVLFLSSSVVLMIWRWRKVLSHLNWDHPLCWATISGVLLGIGFPGDIGFSPFLLVAFIPLFRMEQLIRQSADKPQRSKVFNYSFQAFIIWNILSTYWLANASLAAGIFTILANSALMSLTMVLWHQARISMPKFSIFPFIVFWLFFEYFHFRWDLAWPWLTLGNGLAEWPSIIQWYDHTGVLGGSLWILLINWYLFKGISNFSRKENWKTDLIYFALILFVPIIVSIIQFNRSFDSSKSIEVLAVQPNYEPHYQKRQVSTVIQMSHIIELVASKITEKTEFIVLPEASLGYFELGGLENYPQIRRFRDLQEQFPNLKVIGGFSIFKDLGSQKIEGPFIRERESDGQKIYYEVYNAALQISPGTLETPLYKKSKLVPGPEFFPFSRFLGFLKPLVQKLGGTTASFGTQKDRAVFENNSARIAPVICYESVFGEYLTRYTKKGAQAIFIMTNDGWWDNTAGYKQHAAFANIRAIENRRPVIRAASTGISCFIDVKGKSYNRTSYNKPAAIISKVYLNDSITFYLKWGDMLGRLAMFISVLFLLNLFVKGALPEKQ